MALALAMLMSATASAAETVGTSGMSGETVVELTADATTFDVEVPTVLPVTVDADGKVTVSNNVTIKNNSVAPVKITDFQVVGLNGWEVVDSARIGVEAFNTDVFWLDIHADEGLHTWRAIAPGASYHVEYEAKVPARKEAVSDLEIGKAIFTVGWDKVTETGGGGLADNAVLYEDGTLVFQHGAEPVEGHGEIIGGPWTGWDIVDYTRHSDVPWDSQCTSIKVVDFVASVKPVCTSYWFLECANLTEVRNIRNLDVSGVTNMTQMFASCSRLTSLDVSEWDVSRVVSMIGTFYCCSGLTSLDVSKWDTSSVTSMQGLFFQCSGLSSLDVSRWNTAKVTAMNYMFNGCSSLTTLDVSKWDTSSVTDMTGVFDGCAGLTSLDVSGWNTSNVIGMGVMFGGCSGIAFLDVSEWDTSSVTTFGSMFDGCAGLTSLDVSRWNTSNVRATANMFDGCSSLVALDFSSWDTSNLTTDMQMFRGSGLTSLVLGSKWKWLSRYRSPYLPGSYWYDAVTGTKYTDMTIPDGAGHYVTTPPAA